MPKPSPKKPDKQLDLPTATPASSAAPTTKVLPMQLRVGDRIADETGEWEVVGQPYRTVGGKIAHVRVQPVDNPGVTETRMWGSYEKVGVRRGS